jgi:hypothetical protein
MRDVFMSSLPNWKKFEKVIKIIQEQLIPNAKVIHDYRIPNRKGRKRQIDVYIEHKLGFITYKTIIECKDYKRAVTVDQLEGFPTKMKDVGAHAGIVISKSGFSDGVKDLASEYNFKIMTYREAEHADWSNLFGESAWVTMLKPHHLENIHFKLRLESEQIIDAVPEIMLFNEKGDAIDTVENQTHKELHPILMSKKEIAAWNEFELTQGGRRLFIQSSDLFELIPIDQIIVSGNIIHEAFFINLQLSEGKIITDATTNMNEYIELASNFFNWQEIFETQTGKILSMEEFLIIKSQGLMGHIVETAHLQPYLQVVITQRKE